MKVKSEFDHTVPMSLSLKVSMIHDIDRCVDGRQVRSRSEFVRDAVLEHLKKYEEKREPHDL